MIKRLFLPNRHKQKRSFVLLPHSMIGYSLFLFTIIIFARSITIGNVLGYASDVNINDLLKYTNEIRSKEGLPALKISPVLTSAAQAKGEDMIKYNYWAHTSPNNKEPWDFMRDVGYEYIYAGENLAMDFGHSKAVVEAWYNSPSHRENLMSDKYTEIGFAVVNGKLLDRDTTLVVQMFGYPRNQVLSKQPNLPSDAVMVELPESTSVIIAEPKVKQELLNQNNQLEASPNLGNVVQSIPASISKIEIYKMSQYVALILGLYLIITFAIDGYYTRKEKTLRISGHTILHICILIFVIIGIWYTNIGLVL